MKGLREERASRGVSQEELAEILGVSRETVCRIERGRPPRHRLKTMIEVWMMSKKENYAKRNKP